MARYNHRRFEVQIENQTIIVLASDDTDTPRNPNSILAILDVKEHHMMTHNHHIMVTHKLPGRNIAGRRQDDPGVRLLRPGRQEQDLVHQFQEDCHERADPRKRVAGR